jgi:lysophospholipase L1-like esterase
MSAAATPTGTAGTGPASASPAAPMGGAGLERALTWRGLAWVVARQHRIALIGCAVLYAVAAMLLAAGGAQMRGSYQQLGLASCKLPPQTIPCLAGVAQFTQDYAVWARLIPLLLLAVPVLAGAFAGGPVLGQDLDRGTFRFAWTQGAGRDRLLVAKLVLLGGPLVLAGAGIAALSSWWFSPLYALDNGRLAPQFFVPLGPAFAAWTLLAFALGVAAGAALRRVVPAIAAALAAWTGLAVVTGIWLRYHLYRAPLRSTASFGRPVQEPPQVGLPHRVNILNNSVPPRAYGMGGWFVGRSGQVVNRVKTPSGGPNPPANAQASPIGSAAPHGAASSVPAHAPFIPLRLRGIHIVTIYQPDSRFWPFQWAETGWLAILSALLLAVAFYLSRRPHPLGLGPVRLGPVRLGPVRLGPVRLGAWRRAAAGSPQAAAAGLAAGSPEAAAGLVAGPSAVPARRTADTATTAGTGLPLQRTLTWRGLAWVAWRQHRTALRGCMALFGAAALLLVINGLAMRGLYHQLGLSGCQMRNLTPDCAAGLQQFRQDFGTWLGLVPLLLLLVPVTAGAFTGAAVAARDLERGTFRFAWTQGCGRLRLLAAKLAVLAAALLLASSAVGALASWWFSPLYALGYARLNPQYFGFQPPVFAAWTLLAFAIAAAAGSLLRRVVVAVVATLAAYAGLAVPAGVVLRYRFYRPPVRVTAGLGDTSLSLPPRSVPTGTWWAGSGGKVIPQAQVAHAISSLKSPLALAHWFLQHDARLVVTYQPDSRYWPFQWTETAWLVAVSAALFAASFVLARRRARRSAAGWLVLAAVVLAATASAGGYRLAAAGSTHPAAPATQSAPSSAQGAGGPGYLALGDSVAFGYRPTSVTPAADYANPASFTGYPSDVAKALGLHLVNASCPGETTSSMINQNAPSNGCETSAHGAPGYRGLAPLHVSYSGSQLSYAVRYLEQHPDTQLVTIDIGANDMFGCQQTTADHCTGADSGAALATVTRNLDTILNALRNQAHYQRTLVVLTYYALNYDDPASVAQTKVLNAAIAGPAARYGARLADGFAAFRAASARAGGDTCAAGLGIRLPSGGCDEHPSAHGQQVLATAIQEAIGGAGP